MKLGEALVKEALITKDQLHQALERQVQFGGRIGTNLIELRFIAEEDLSKFLSKYFRIPAADSEAINNIPEEVLSLISTDIVEKYQILPFRKDRSKLHTAMLNPKDIMEIDELRFRTGFDIIPYVITESRLLYAFEKYYGIKRDLRYISLTDRFNPETKVEESSVQKVKQAFSEVKDTEEIAGILLNEIFKLTKRVALFTLKGDKITGWKSRGLDTEQFARPAAESPVFAEVIRSRANYRGPVMKIQGNEALISLLSGTPQDALVLPIALREKVIALLYVDNGNNTVLDASVGYLCQLSQMATLAFELVILKRKILDLDTSSAKK
jgi:hypothetical protein